MAKPAGDSSSGPDPLERPRQITIDVLSTDKRTIAVLRDLGGEVKTLREKNEALQTAEEELKEINDALTVRHFALLKIMSGALTLLRADARPTVLRILKAALSGGQTKTTIPELTQAEGGKSQENGQNGDSPVISVNLLPEKQQEQNRLRDNRLYWVWTHLVKYYPWLRKYAAPLLIGVVILSFALGMVHFTPPTVIATEIITVDTGESLTVYVLCESNWRWDFEDKLAPDGKGNGLSIEDHGAWRRWYRHPGGDAKRISLKETELKVSLESDGLYWVNIHLAIPDSLNLRENGSPKKIPPPFLVSSTADPEILRRIRARSKAQSR